MLDATRSGTGARDDEVLERRLGLHPVLVTADHDRLPQDVLADDAAVALDALDARPHRRQLAAHLLVRGVLVAQAALEPPALSRELRRVQGQTLFLHHLDRDRLELAQPGRAAQLAPADAHPARHLRLVPRADLLEIDADAEQLA